MNACGIPQRLDARLCRRFAQQIAIITARLFRELHECVGAWRSASAMAYPGGRICNFHHTKSG
jgi:hypothetical protein